MIRIPWRHASLALCLCTMVFLVVPAASGQKKDENTPDKKTAPVNSKKAKLSAAVSVIGRITKMEDDTFTLEVGTGKAKTQMSIQIAEDAKFRVPQPLEFDDKGRPKKAKKDNTDIDRRLGGVKGARDDMRSGQQVEVTVGRLPNKQYVATVIKILPEAGK